MSTIEQFEKLAIEFGNDCKQLLEKILHMQHLLCTEICDVRYTCPVKELMLTSLATEKVKSSTAPLHLLDVLPSFLNELHSHTKLLVVKRLLGE